MVHVHTSKSLRLLLRRFGLKLKKNESETRSLELAMQELCMDWREFGSTMEMRQALRKIMKARYL